MGIYIWPQKSIHVLIHVWEQIHVCDWSSMRAYDIDCQENRNMFRLSHYTHHLSKSFFNLSNLRKKEYISMASSSATGHHQAYQCCFSPISMPVWGEKYPSSSSRKPWSCPVTSCPITLLRNGTFATGWYSWISQWPLTQLKTPFLSTSLNTEMVLRAWAFSGFTLFCLTNHKEFPPEIQNQLSGICFVALFSHPWSSLWSLSPSQLTKTLSCLSILIRANKAAKNLKHK